MHEHRYSLKLLRAQAKFQGRWYEFPHSILCMENVFTQSRLATEDVSYIYAHVASTPPGHLNEYLAITRSFGKSLGYKRNEKIQF